MTSRAPPDPAETEALLTLMDAFGRVKLSLQDMTPRWSSEMQAQLQAAGMDSASGPEQLGALRQFHRAYRLLGTPVSGGSAGLSMSEVSERLGTPLSSATRLVDQMVLRGLLERRPDAHDRRMVLVRVTERGEAVYRIFDAAFRQYLQQMLAQLSADEREQLLHLGQRIFDVWSASVASHTDAPGPQD